MSIIHKHELWVWMMPDDDGKLCAAYVETAGATKVPMIAATREGARALRPIAERMADLYEMPWTLVKFTDGTEEETITP